MNIRVPPDRGFNPVSKPPRPSINRVPGRPTPSVSESSDDYPHVVVALDDKTRVIAADIQWIIQKRRRNGSNGWEGVYFCRSKAGLLMYAPKVTPELLALPDWFPEAA